MSAVVAFIDIREMGHTSSAMVERVYGHLNDQSLAGAVNALPSVENLSSIPVTRPCSPVMDLVFAEASETIETVPFREIPATCCAPGGS